MNEDRKPPVPDPRTGMDEADDVLDMIARAEGVVSDLCAGRIRWSMSIPARPDSDPDLVISRALSESAAEVRLLRAENATADTEANGYPLTEARLEIDRLRTALSEQGELYNRLTEARNNQILELDSALASERDKRKCRGNECESFDCENCDDARPAPDATALREALSLLPRYAMDVMRGEMFEIAHGAYIKINDALFAIPPRDAPGEPEAGR